MSVDTRRFLTRTVIPGQVSILDRNGPHYWETVDSSKMPSMAEIAQMTEAEYDAVLSDLIYKGDPK